MHRVVTWVAGLISAPSRLRAALLAAGLVLIPALVTAQTWQYLYDEVGRLKSAIAPSGDRADYEYDAVGNIVAIRRSGASALNISEFTPQIGKSGTSVKIIGSGFSTTLASNVVKFNGVTATVTAATATQLTVSAPATGSTGPISVTVGANTVTTREAFVYSSTIVTGPPTITSASLSCAIAGATITLTGTNFDVAPGATRVEVGNAVAATTVTSPTALSFVVPSGATSAIRVVTSLGVSALSTQLFVPPVGTCAEYETPLRPVVNGAATTLSISTAGKKAIVLFSGAEGAAFSLQFTNIVPSVAGTMLTYTVYNTANASIAVGQVTPASASIHVPVLPLAGTYAVVFTWNSPTVTGSASVRLVTSAALGVTGTSLNSSVTIPGQSVRVSFVGAAGQDWTLDISNLTLSTGGQHLSYQVVRTDGVSVATGTCYSNGLGCATTWKGLSPGTHTVTLTPSPNTATGSATLKSWSSSRVTGALTIGTASTYTSTVFGQMVERTFSGTAGQQLGLALTNFTTAIGGAALTAMVINPDGTLLTGTTFGPAQTAPLPHVWNIPALPASGTYKVQVYPLNSGTVHMTTTFSGQVLVSSDATASLATDGTPLPLNLTQPGQQARVSFVGVAGKDWMFEISGLTMTAGGRVPYSIFPSGGGNSLQGYCQPNGTGCSIAWPVMSAGTHTIVLTPEQTNAPVSMTLKSWASSRITGSLTVGTAANYVSTTPGQRVQYTFSGAVGQQRGLTLSNFSTSVSGATLSAEVLRPDGSQLTSTNFTSASSAGGYVLNLPVLAVTGTYSVLVHPRDAPSTFNGQVLVTQDVAATLATNGTATSVSISQPGQQARVAFTGLAGQDLTLELSALALTNGQSMTYEVIRSDGASMVWGTCNVSGAGCWNVWRGMTAGTHTLLLQPSYPGTATGSVNIKSWASNRVTGSLTVDTTSTLASTVPGQMVQYTFSGTAGQQLGLTLSNFTTSIAGSTLTANVLKPDGTPLVNTTFTAAQTAPTAKLLDLPALPAAGTYVVQVHPSNSGNVQVTTTFTGQVRLTADVAATLATNGTPTLMTLAQPGQQARATFTGVAGQDLILDLSGLTLSSGGQYMQFRLLRSDGGLAFTGFCTLSGSGCTNAWRGMLAGTHTVELTPYPATVTGNVTLKAWASSRVTGALSIGTAATYTSTVPGQAVQFTFNGTAGQQLGLRLTNFTTSITGTALAASVLRPDGVTIASTQFPAAETSAGPRGTRLPVLPTTGTYSVLVHPSISNDSKMTSTFGGQVSVNILQDVTATLATNGTETVITLPQPGQVARLTFAGTAAKDWALETRNLNLASTTSDYLGIAVNKPDASSLTSWSCNEGPSCGRVGTQLPTAGTYTVVTTPSQNLTGSFGLKLWLSSPVTAALTSGVTSTLSTSTPGQRAHFTFSGTAGQQLTLSLSGATSIPGAMVSLIVLAPSGAQIDWSGRTLTSTAVPIPLSALTQTGTYSVYLAPMYYSDPASPLTTFTASLKVAPTAGPGTDGGPLPTDNSLKNVTFATPGETVDQSFNASNGDELAIDLSQLVLNGGANDSVQFSLVPPVGSPYSPITCFENGTGCSVTYTGLFYSGTYKLRLIAQSGLTGTVNVRARKYVPLTGTLFIGSPLTVTTNTTGQTGRYTFDGTAGQLLRLSLSNASSATGVSYIGVYVFAPDWSYVGGTGVAPGGTQSTDLPALPSTGTYRIDFYGSPPGTFSVRALVAPR